MAKVSVMVPKGFHDGQKFIYGGHHIVTEEKARRWSADKKAEILDETFEEEVKSEGKQETAAITTQANSETKSAKAGK